tara:strand:+ start:603 stop:1028 length:426 start_codon:yes stop_codon:yes gene_type:complete
MDTDYQIHLNRIKNKDIFLSIENKNERTKYEITFSEASPFWIQYMKFFQNDFNHFYRTLELIFVNQSKGMKWKITNEMKEKLFINITYDPGILIFGFDITFEIPREEDRIERLIKKVEKLEEENRYMLTLIHSLEDKCKGK